MGPYQGSSFPNFSDTQRGPQNTISAGKHDYVNSYGHSSGSQKGLNIVDNNGQRNVSGTNPEGGSVVMTGVNIHEGASEINRGSAGCPTIRPGDAESFFNNFDWSGNRGTTGNSTGSVRIYRGNTIGSVMHKSYLKVRQWLQKSF